MQKLRWHLLNIKTLQKQGKKFYLSPSKASIYAHLREKGFFQLMIRSNNQKKNFIAVEKLWCQFIGRRDGLYVGRLVSIPKLIHELHFGQEIEFCAEHILGCLHPHKAEESFAMNTTRNLAFLNKILLQQTSLPTQWVREMPQGKRDTGWRLLTQTLESSTEAITFDAFQLDETATWSQILKGTIGSYLAPKVVPIGSPLSLF